MNNRDSMDKKKKLFLLPAALALLLAGCGTHEEKPVTAVSQAAPVAVESIVPVREAGVPGQSERLLVPAKAVFHNGELSGVLVVGADNRISQRWIRLGRSMNGDVVVLGGVDKGELVVGVYNPELGEGVTVIKSQKVTEEVQSK
jgi:hypothetical protein